MPGPFREKTRPARPLQRPFREKTRPASTKTPNLGCFKRAGRTISRFRDDAAPQGELFRAHMKPPPRKPGRKGDSGFSLATRCTEKASDALDTGPMPDSTALQWQLSTAMPLRNKHHRDDEPPQFRTQFQLSPTPHQRRIRRIPTIRLQTMKHIRRNCTRNCWDGTDSSPEISHAIRLNELSTKPRNVAIPTI